MDPSPIWIAPRAEESSAGAYPPVTGSGTFIPTDSFANDLFRDKFMSIARGGSNGEKIMRGFLIGLAIGLIVACFVCCWYPCCRPKNASLRRRPRRRPVTEADEETPATATATATAETTTTNRIPPA